jgi:hypothetical protein
MIIKDSAGQSWVVKFKYEDISKAKFGREGRCKSVISWEEKETLCGVKRIEDGINDYLYVRVSCTRNDPWNKAVGRELAFLKIIRLMHFDNVEFINVYNKTFKKKIIIED